MEKNTTGILVALLVAILVLGVGYAAISNITLTITGNATASAASDNFKVLFTGTPVPAGSGTVTPVVTGDHTATFTVTGLTTAGQTASATYTISNQSAGLAASNVVASNVCSITNTEYFNITCNLASNSIASGADTTLQVTVELLKTPIDEVTGAVTVNYEFEPVTE